jgi:hypothetical protein
VAPHDETARQLPFSARGERLHDVVSERADKKRTRPEKRLIDVKGA